MGTKKTILFLAANPSDTTRLKLGTEFKEIKNGLSQSTHRDDFDFEQIWATTPIDMQDAILMLKPHIVHFSGHGSGEDGLVLEDDQGQAKLVSAQVLSRVFKQFDDCVECVVLNACYSEVQSNAIAQYIPYTVGMNQAIGDRAAIEFAVGFYKALGEGRDIKFAFEYGCNRIALQDIPEDLTPVLIPQTSVARRWPERFPTPVEQEPGPDSRKATVVQPPSERQSNTQLQSPAAINTDEIMLATQEGAVDPHSRFYVRSALEDRAYEAVHQPGALLRIKSPQGMGKSSLSIRVLEHAKSQRHRTVTLDLKQTNTRFFEDLDKFAQWFCASVGKPLGVRIKMADIWDDIFGPNDNCTDYFEQYLLTGSPLTLALENFDRLFDYPDLEIDFCGLLRGWHERAKRDAQWGQLRLIIVYSQESYIPKDINQSPFNVGVPIELGPWTLVEVADLACRYGLNLGAQDLDCLMTLTGGHPQLVQLTLPPLALGEMTLSQMEKTAATEAGIYSSHLLERLNYLEANPGLKAAMQQVVMSDSPVRFKPQDVHKLYSAGLIKHRENNTVEPLCEAYRGYFRERLVA